MLLGSTPSGVLWNYDPTFPGANGLLVGAITATVEANNYFNMPSLLWNGNTILVPFVKLAYYAEHKIPLGVSTEFVNVIDYLGLMVGGVYTAACVHAALPKGKKEE